MFRFFLKLLTILLLVFIFSPKGINAALIQRAPNNLGLIGYWSFNDGAGTKATDSSGNGNVGSFNGSPTWGGGRLGQAVSFGGSDYISVSDNKFLEPSIPFSISFWLKTTQTGNKVIIEKDGNAGYSVQREDNNAIKISIGDSGGTLEIESAHTYNDGKWHHVVFVAQSPASNSKVYVDSVDDTSGTPNNGFPSYSTGSLYIGSRAGSFGYQGVLDEVRIYNRALTAAEATALYRTGLSVTNSSAQNNKITNGLVGLWSFNGQDMDWSQSTAEALDRSGQNNNGDVIGGARPISGISGQALSFDGVDDYMTTVNNTISGTGAISYGAWIKTTQTGQNKHIFNIGAATNDNMVHMMLYDGTIKYGAWGTDLYSGLTYNDGKWHYIMVVYNTTQFLLYVDGSLENPADNYSSLNITAAPLYIGEYRGGGNYYFQGFIDDIRIYNRALTTAEITDLYKMGAARTQTNTSQVNKYKDGSLVLLQTFNGPDMDWSQSSAEARDRSGQNNNGDVIGGAKPISGVSGQALSFDGSNDYVEITDHSSLDISNSITISAWINPKTLDDLGYSRYFGVIAKRNAENQDVNYEVRVGNDYMNNGTNVLHFAFRVGGNWHLWDTYGSATGLVANKWQHLGITFTYGVGSSIKYYLDGVDKSSLGSWKIDTGNATPNNDAWPVHIGDCNTGTGSGRTQFDGLIDEVRIYNRALSATEILKLYRGGK